MNNKEIFEDLIQHIPEGAWFHDIAQEMEFVAAVRQGLDELDRGERIRLEEVDREPVPLNNSGFFEDFFDEKTKAVATFWRVVNQRLAAVQRRVA